MSSGSSWSSLYTGYDSGLMYGSHITMRPPGRSTRTASAKKLRRRRQVVEHVEQHQRAQARVREWQRVRARLAVVPGGAHEVGQLDAGE